MNTRQNGGASLSNAEPGNSDKFTLLRSVGERPSIATRCGRCHAPQGHRHPRRRSCCPAAASVLTGCTSDRLRSLSPAGKIAMATSPWAPRWGRRGAQPQATAGDKRMAHTAALLIVGPTEPIHGRTRHSANILGDCDAPSPRVDGGVLLPPRWPSRRIVGEPTEPMMQPGTTAVTGGAQLWRELDAVSLCQRCTTLDTVGHLRAIVT
jgi:hypothetical protein